MCIRDSMTDGQQVLIGNRRLMERYNVQGYPTEAAEYGTEVLVAEGNTSVSYTHLFIITNICLKILCIFVILIIEIILLVILINFRYLAV